MQNSDDCIWRSRRALSTKLRLYNTCILPMCCADQNAGFCQKQMQVRSVSWTSSVLGGSLTYAGISVCPTLKCGEYQPQPPLTSIIQKTRLMLFDHLARMDESADARRILFRRVIEKGRQDVLTLPGW